MKSSITHSVYCLLAILHVAIRFLPSAAQVPCNSFPKIFGGSLNDTFVGQIDVFDDYLAFYGITYDLSLTSFNNQIPYIALTSISLNMYYWAKAWDQIVSNSYAALQFSSDGAFLIAHTRGSSPTGIIVFDVNSGKVISARNY